MIISLVALLSMVSTNIDHVDLNLANDEIGFTFFDLSDGEAALIQNTEQNVLINTGSKMAEYELFERLQMYGVDHIERLIITNSAQAYTGNLKKVLETYNVKTLISSKAIIDDLEKRVDLSGVDLHIWSNGKQSDVLPGLKTNVLYETPSETESPDDKALVVRLRYGKDKVLYMGLADRKVERQLIDSPLIDCEILKVGDFGKEYVTVPQFLENVNPQVAILFHKQGLRPNKRMLEQFDDVWIDVYHTHHAGPVSIKFDRQSYKVITIPIDKGDSI